MVINALNAVTVALNQTKHYKKSAKNIKDQSFPK